MNNTFFHRVVVTNNWQGTADKMLEQNPLVLEPGFKYHQRATLVEAER